MRIPTTVLAVATILAWGQGTAAPRTPKATGGNAVSNLRFPALEEFDRREKFTRLHQQALLQTQEYQQRLKETNAIFIALGHFRKHSSIDKKITEGIRIRRDLLVALDGLQSGRGRCIQILELVAEAARNTAMPAETMRYLKGVRNTATNMLRLLNGQTKRLRSADAALKKTLRRLPPPPSFTNHLGLPMVLVRNGKSTFYISRIPVPEEKLAQAFGSAGTKPPESLTWFQARHFCRWLSEAESGLYRMPSVEHLQQFAAHGGHISRPLWTQTIDEPKDNSERRMRERFGVNLVRVFDPAKTLGDQVERGEVPFAAHPQMAFHVVTPVETGWWFRWNTLKQTLDE